MTVDQIAARAGAGKAAIYRRYASKAEMAFVATAHGQWPPPLADTGSLQGDLLALARTFHLPMASPAARHLVPALIGELAADPDLVNRNMRSPWDDEHPFFDGWFHNSCVRSFERREEFRAELMSSICAGVHTIPIRGIDGTINQLERTGLGYTDKVYSCAVGDIYQHHYSQNLVFVEREGPVHFLDPDDAQAVYHKGFVRGADGDRKAFLRRDPGPDIANWGLRELLEFLDIRTCTRCCWTA